MIHLWNHQEQALSFFRQNGNGVLYRHDLGTGKTITSLATIKTVSKALGRPARVLILTPKSVLSHWRKEIQVFKPAANSYCVLSKNKKERIRQLANPALTKIITNHHSLHDSDIIEAFKNFKFDALIIDESHRFKNPETKWWKALVELSDLTKVKILLTGTPILNNPLDLYGQMRLLSPKIFNESYFIFKKRYFLDDTENKRKEYLKKLNPNNDIAIRKECLIKAMRRFPPKLNMRPGAMADLQYICRSWIHQVDKKDVLDLPPYIEQEVICELSEKERVDYDNVKNQVLEEISQEYLAQNALVKTLRLAQFCANNGHKLDELRNILSQTGKESVIIWTCFKQPIGAITELLVEMGITHCVVTGDTKQVERDANIHNFQNGFVRVFVGTQAACGTGIELTRASYAIYYSKSYNLGDDLQSAARNYRAGSEQHKSVTRIDLITEGTIEEVITLALKKKMNIAEEILKLIKENI